MSIALATRGYLTPPSSGGGSVSAPVLSNITPDVDEAPGQPGAFSSAFKLARLTPIEFDITNIAPGAQIAITVHYEDRNETYVALDVRGVWRWPFDVSGDNTIGDLTSEPVHVSMLPRGGWPPTVVSFEVAAAKATASGS